MRKALRQKRFEWRKHALQRLAERNIPQRQILNVLRTGKLIEDYLEDKPYPSSLFLGIIEGRPLHVVVAYDEANDWAYIITAYEPGMEKFEPDFVTRRKK
ncbi:MAG: DUF4258 domain-containing protein [Candidatus Lindowbacteria bacterium]|nr:DUF4258 domain-containing protein [Candidatus Lindowbacteria bacterium]